MIMIAKWENAFSNDFYHMHGQRMLDCRLPYPMGLKITFKLRSLLSEVMDWLFAVDCQVLWIAFTGALGLFRSCSSPDRAGKF